VSGALRTIESELDVLERLIRGVRAQHVNSQSAKGAVKEFVQRYFVQWREVIAGALGNGDQLPALDGEMQELLRCAQRRTLTEEYRGRLRALRTTINAAEVLILSAPVRGVGAAEAGQRERRILETLRRVCAPAAASFEQGLKDVRAGERVSWRGTAVEFREALREILDTLAPDDDVKNQAGFRLEPDAKGPTMKQKAVFILRSRRPKDPQIKSLSDAVDIIEELVGKLVRSVYTRSSLAVHVQMSRDEALRIRDYVTLVLSELLEIKE
jgi:hypothetical protein